MTTITLETPPSTGRLEELVDRMLAVLFRYESEQGEPAPSLVGTVHEARRLRQSGDLDGALAALADVDTKGATEDQLRWLYAEWLDIARRRFTDDNAVLYSPPREGGGAGSHRRRQRQNLESRRLPGNVLAGRQGGLPAQPAGVEAAGEGRSVMVVANRTVDIAELKARHPLGDAVEAAGIVLRARAGSGRASAPSTRKQKGASRCTPTRRNSTASAAAPPETCWTSWAGWKG